jgi:hypothetical protein
MGIELSFFVNRNRGQLKIALESHANREPALHSILEFKLNFYVIRILCNLDPRAIFKQP